MLYPLSYEGPLPIPYRPGDIPECPGVLWGAQAMPFGVPVAVPSLVGGDAEQIARTRGPACPTVTEGAPR
jgi:hypothetical protein